MAKSSKREKERKRKIDKKWVLVNLFSFFWFWFEEFGIYQIVKIDTQNGLLWPTIYAVCILAMDWKQWLYVWLYHCEMNGCECAGLCAHFIHKFHFYIILHITSTIQILLKNVITSYKFNNNSNQYIACKIKAIPSCRVCGCAQVSIFPHKMLLLNFTLKAMHSSERKTWSNEYGYNKTLRKQLSLKRPFITHVHGIK